MNTQITALALNELSEQERQRLLAEIETHPELQNELRETQQFCEWLQREIGPAHAPSLTAEQHASLNSLFTDPPAPPSVPSPKVRPFPIRSLLAGMGALAAAYAFTTLLPQLPIPQKGELHAKAAPSPASSSSLAPLPSAPLASKDLESAKPLPLAPPLHTPPAHTLIPGNTGAVQGSLLSGFKPEPQPSRANASVLVASKPPNIAKSIPTAQQPTLAPVYDAQVRPLPIAMASARMAAPEKEAKSVQETVMRLQRKDASEAIPSVGMPGDVTVPGTAVLRELAPVYRLQIEANKPLSESPFLYTEKEPLSTFSTDVDTASYSLTRRLLQQGLRPAADAIRLEEFVNYFPYRYPAPTNDHPLGVTVDLAEAPWQPLHRIARIALQARGIAPEKRSAANLVFLVDVSGSMNSPERLPLLKESLLLLVDQLRQDDRVSIVTYAGECRVLLESTTGDQKERIRSAIQSLRAAGSTNGESGIRLAYEQAAAHFERDRIHRVILCTDGDFNVGIQSPAELESLIAEKAKSGVFLSVLGFGQGSFGDRTMMALANRGNGNYAAVDSASEARKVLVHQLAGTLVPMAKDVKIQVEFNPAQVAAYRLLGYEKRHLENRDFNDDRKDAADLGAGQSVTALYEIVPARLQHPDGKPLVDGLKYAPKTPAPAQTPSSPECLTVKVRYKLPDAEASEVLELPVTDSGKKLAESDSEFQFATSVAGFAMLLRGSAHAGNLTWNDVREMARRSKGEDPLGYRGEFLQLIDRAQSVAPR
jgi:secreted protein with Ig-like and vWFA domain